jgi:hypothetical protein
MFDTSQYAGEIRTDSIYVSQDLQTVSLYLSPEATYIPARPGWIKRAKTDIMAQLGRRFRDYRPLLFAGGHSLEYYIPNYYRAPGQNIDSSRTAAPYTGPAWVTDLGKPVFNGGLTGKHIALWPSHGYYYDQFLDRWQWQRARLYGTVEDIFPYSFTSGYLVPMLENAGATVILPRERDTQIHEVIVDNDGVTGNSMLIMVDGNTSWKQTIDKGFAPMDTLYEGENPFELGTFLAIESFQTDSSSLTYMPEIPETGDYAVYVSWGKTERCVNRVRCEVIHTGGSAEYLLNQCMGAGTWVYLGTFHFDKGLDKARGAVVIYGNGPGGTITSDAVRFGGGMGNVARKPGSNPVSRQATAQDVSQSDTTEQARYQKMIRYKTSGKPRWMEGARYYLQYAGAPDTLVYTLSKGQNDYADDYMSRSEWVNYLMGAPNGPTKDPDLPGLHIPVDLTLAFHTDAGVTPDDSVIGTLGIYSTYKNKGTYPTGRSSIASRDLTDIIQTQIVFDIRRMYNPQWTRRALWDRQYSEAWRPNTPAMLLELLSHQNLADMKFGLDPRFKFTVARAVYKGILRFLAGQQGQQVVIQPLSPDHMAIRQLDSLKVRISWKPVMDPFEPTAAPSGYKLYRKLERNGFESGIYTQDTFLVVSLPEWRKIYSFRVTALNEGGESFPGEILSVALFPDQPKPVLVVNAFDRICGPAVFDKGNMAGLAWWDDEGVVYGTECSYTGRQYDFYRNSEWKDDDSQGWGASFADLEGAYLPGNTFDFPLLHGEALREAGYSFVSVSDEVFASPDFPVSDYRAVDLIFGEERGTPVFSDSSRKEFRVFTRGLMETIKRFAFAGGNILASGAYIGTDMEENQDSAAIQFARDILHYTWRTNHATNEGTVQVTDVARDLFPHELYFNAGGDPGTYRVEAPDAIEPCGGGAFRIYRYASGKSCAGVASENAYRTVVLGFPFETIRPEEQRNRLMAQIMLFFSGKSHDE